MRGSPTLFISPTTIRNPARCLQVQSDQVALQTAEEDFKCAVRCLAPLPTPTEFYCFCHHFVGEVLWGPRVLGGKVQGEGRASALTPTAPAGYRQWLSASSPVNEEGHSLKGALPKTKMGAMGGQIPCESQTKAEYSFEGRCTHMVYPMCAIPKVCQHLEVFWWSLDSRGSV